MQAFISIVMIMVRLHFFRAEFKHIIEERQKKKFSLARTISRVGTTAKQPFSGVKRRFSMNPKADGANEKVCRSSVMQKHSLTEKGKQDGRPPFEQDQNGSTPSSVEMKGISRPPNSAPPAAWRDDPVFADESDEEAERNRSETKSHHQKKKKKFKVSKDMIKRVEGGGVGMMNPMGWYDSGRDTPGILSTEETPFPVTGRADTADNSVPMQRRPTGDGAMENIEEEPRTESPVAMQDPPHEVASGPKRGSLLTSDGGMGQPGISILQGSSQPLADSPPMRSSSECVRACVSCAVADPLDCRPRRCLMQAGC